MIIRVNDWLLTLLWWTQVFCVIEFETKPKTWTVKLDKMTKRTLTPLNIHPPHCTNLSRGIPLSSSVAVLSMVCINPPHLITTLTASMWSTWVTTLKPSPLLLSGDQSEDRIVRMDQWEDRMERMDQSECSLMTQDSWEEDSCLPWSESELIWHPRVWSPAPLMTGRHLTNIIWCHKQQCTFNLIHLSKSKVFKIVKNNFWILILWTLHWYAE